MTPAELLALRVTARQIRRTFLTMHYGAKSGHIGTGLSSIDILNYLYRCWLNEDDLFILSKGHGASALYATLHSVGLLSDELLATYYRDGTLLAAHPVAGAHPKIPVATGSLGHGFPVAVGLAYAHKCLRRSKTRVACLLSDGECNEGSIWEAAMFAFHHKLDNLVAVVDANGLQGFGSTREVLDTEPLTEKWRSFGFAVREVDGHDFAALDDALSTHVDGRPLALIARTHKGKGVLAMENKLEWHYLPMNEEQYQAAVTDLENDAAKDRSQCG